MIAIIHGSMKKNNVGAVFRNLRRKIKTHHRTCLFQGQVAAVLAGVARDSGVEKNSSWSTSDQAGFTANRESSFNFRSRILRFVYRRTSPGGCVRMEHSKFFRPTGKSPVLFSFTGRAVRCL